jgi:hypothetical protein
MLIGQIQPDRDPRKALGTDLFDFEPGARGECRYGRAEAEQGRG